MKIRKTDDIELWNAVQQQLRDNSGYCPCKLEKIEDNKCMCKEFREQEYGSCHCGLYVKGED